MGECALCCRAVLLESDRFPTMQREPTHISNLFHREVCICWNTRVPSPSPCSDIDDDHDRPRAKPFEQLGDFQIGGPQPWSCVVESDRFLFGCGTQLRQSVGLHDRRIEVTNR